MSYQLFMLEVDLVDHSLIVPSQSVLVSDTGLFIIAKKEFAEKHSNLEWLPVEDQVINDLIKLNDNNYSQIKTLI